VVQGVTLHVFWAERYGLKLTAERRAEVQLLTMAARLARTLYWDEAQRRWVLVDAQLDDVQLPV